MVPDDEHSLPPLPPIPNSAGGTTNLWEALYSQRAIRYWRDEPVPEPLLWRVIEAATRAPSGSNLQPWAFVVVQDPAQRKEIASLVRAFYEQTEGLKTMVESGKESFERSWRLILKGAKALFEGLDKAPVIIVPCLYRLTSPTSDMDSYLAGSSIYLAVQNLLLASRGLGLGGVMTTLQAPIEDQLRTLLKVPPDARPMALIPMGFPAVKFGSTKRRPVEAVTHWDEWGTMRSRREL